MRQVRGQEVHWYLIIMKTFFIYPRNSVTSYLHININEAGPWTGKAQVFNHKPAFFLFIQEIL